MIKFISILIIGVLIGSISMYFYQGKKIEDLKVALGIIQIRPFIVSHYLEVENISDEEAYCLRYGLAKAMANSYKNVLDSGGYFYSSHNEVAKELVDDLHSLEKKGLRYDCKN